MKKLYYPVVLHQEQIGEKIFRIQLECREIAREAWPGQFLNLYCKEGESLLPRPISICQVDREKGRVTLVYAVVGRGTASFSRLKKGDTIKVLGPLGRGFIIDPNIKTHILIGGGMGVPPLVELAKHLRGQVYAFLGFSDTPILVRELEGYGAKVFIATDRGTVGFKGNVIELLKQENIKGDMIYACGPRPMLKAVHDFARDRGIPAQVSMEERMGCGIGVCVGCTCKTRKKGDMDFENRKVCTDGPVFWSEEVIWHE